MLHQSRPGQRALIQRRWCLLSYGSASGVYLKGDLTEHSVTSSHLLFVPWSLTVWIASLFQWLTLFQNQIFLFLFFFPQVVMRHWCRLARCLNRESRLGSNVKSILLSEDTLPPQRLVQLLELIRSLSSAMFLGHECHFWKSRRSLVESWTPTQMN